MGWRLREGESEIATRRVAPDYGPNSEYFTIRLHHSGQLCEFGRRVYVGGKIDHFDYCHVDEMSLIELTEMAKTLQIDTEHVTFFYSGNGINDCNSIAMMSTDLHTLELVNYVDGDRIVGIFIDHGHGHGTPSEGDSSRRLPDIEEGLEYMGDDIEGDMNEGEERQRVEKSEAQSEGQRDGEAEKKSEGQRDNDAEKQRVGGEENEKQRVGVLNNGQMSDDSDDEQSIGNDSCYSDGLVDSELGIGDNESDFGIEVNWGGVGGKGKSSQSMKSNKGKGKEVDKHGGFAVFNSNLDNGDPQFEVGLCFPDTQSFRDAVRQHSIINARDVVFTKNDKNKVQVKCKHDTCKWYIFASKIHGEDTMQVKTLHNEHQCTRVERVSAANSKWLANKYKDKLRTDPKWPVDSMMSVMQKECKLLFSKFQMYRAKEKVAKMSAGSEEQQYGLLWRYAAEITRSNPNTTVKIKTKEVDGKLLFRRFYCCWGALKAGFLDGCRPLICLDGCHLKTYCGGILLCAVGIDGNNCMYPFAYAVVEKEKKSTWLWFLELLMNDLEIPTDSDKWTIMSDKQKGLIDAVDMLLPYCEHRFCVMHLYNNFKLAHKGLGLKMMLWKAAKATRVVDFEKIMNELRGKDLEAFKWLAKRPAAQWSRSYFRCNAKCDILLNNMCESFNATIVEARSRPIVDMLETIRMMLMKRVYVKRDQIKKHKGKLTPNIQKLIEELKKKSMEYIAHWNGKDQFEVESCYGSGSLLESHVHMQFLACISWGSKANIMMVISKAKQGRHNSPSTQQKKKKKTIENVAAASPSKNAASADPSKITVPESLSKTAASASPSKAPILASRSKTTAPASLSKTTASASHSKAPISASHSKTTASAGHAASPSPSTAANQDIHFELPPGCSQQ
ncbi:UNVERIFIED_CONTAM: hypothetical protein Sradi_4508300 [Sesamum radiatum]|uniref:Uncharacterized protein n=1 Tax=Sesamum radiatum TaxID=300843 RepID=A0AAW2N811_SESRA